MASLLIEIARRRQKPGSGSQPLWPTPPSHPMFREVLSIRYVVVGGQATRHYMPKRMTLDWNLLISSDDAESAKADL